VHQLQGEAESVKTPEQIALLQDFYRERLALWTRHVEGAKVVSDYEFNNTYQYVIAREEVHVQWVRDAIVDLGGEVPTKINTMPVPNTGKGLALQAAVIDDDIRNAVAFGDRWRAKIEPMTNARHRGMLKVVLGEVLEHKRFFEQAKAGREDLLGRRMAGASTGDGVLSTRWIE
jgi:Mn-containing catalase